MEELDVFIKNQGKYDEGERVGDWFKLPVDEEVVRERIGLNSQYQEYSFYFDNKLLFEAGENPTIEDLNNLARKALALPECIQEHISELLKHFASFDELYANKDNVIFYSGCGSMEELAHELIDEGNLLQGIADSLRVYFDYAAFARDLESKGRYVVLSAGIFEINT